MFWLSRSALVVNAALGLAAANVPAPAAENTAPIVSSFERFHGQGEQPELGGQLLLGELNCTSCHQAEKDALAHFFPRSAPALDNVGSRVRPEYIQAFLAAPAQVKPGTTMPDPFVGWEAGEKKAAVEALTHYLALSGVINEQRIQPTAVTQGDALYHRLGCAACHDAQKPDSQKLATSTPLGNLGAKYTVPSLAAFLQEPTRARPASRMPTMNLEGEEARQLASYLLRDLKDIQVPANLKFTLYDGAYNKLPDFAQLKPAASGETFGFDLSAMPNKDNFAVRFQGNVNLPRDGEYKFQLASDDGSRLFIDGQQVVDNDGIHGKTVKEGTAKLKAGRHEVIVDYFEQAGGEELEVIVEEKTLGKQPLENLLVVEKKPEPQDKPKFTVDPTLASKGKELFATVGCASCHQMNAGNQRIESKLEAPALASLKTENGCLSADPIKGTPFYSLNGAQRKALAAGIESLKKSPSKPSAEGAIALTMKTLNCVACHQRGELGGIEEARNIHFQTTQKEMGDEGRIPPPLTGVGAKLKPEALKQQLEASPKERPYMLTRMPRFAGFPFAELIAALDQTDKTPLLAKVVHDVPERQFKQAGYTMVGSKGFSCIKCHTWGNVQATGIQSINMQRMTARLKQEWFEAYVLNPPAFRPGTRMPAAWPEGQVLLPKILDGKAETQIRAVWDYLSDGTNARVPLGLGRDPIELVADTEAIMYRNFIEGGGARAIGVGYPEKVNIAFDANNLRLAMIWQGAFMDASKHWVDRGTGFQPPLGDNVLHLHDGVPLATLADDKAPWPTQTAKELGYQFKGYVFDKQRRPTFTYKYGDVTITDAIVPGGDKEKPTLKRTLTFKTDGSAERLFYRAAVDDSIEAVGDGMFGMKNNWQLKIAGGGQPVLRQVGNKAELRVPITFTNGEAKIVQEYVW
jgi:mono/diheme cytochrome c family protein